MRHRKIAILTVATCAMLLALAPAVYTHLEPARILHDTHGIDVSHHQGRIDWKAVASESVAFAFIKATEGGDFIDPRFAENWTSAADAGIRRGAYHFFRQCRTGAVQAENFVRVVPKDVKALRHVVDVEHMGPCLSSPQVQDVVKEIEVFLERLERHYGKRPIIYTTREFHDAYLQGRLSDETFWIRSLVLPPRFRKQHWVLWQYHNRGRRRGISGPVDLNVLRCQTTSGAEWAIPDTCLQ